VGWSPGHKIDKNRCAPFIHSFIVDEWATTNPNQRFSLHFLLSILHIITAFSRTINAGVKKMETTPLNTSKNPAVARCLDAWNSTYKALRDKSEWETTSIQGANKAFRCAMPTLDTPENIRDFVACVAFAMLFGAIEPANGSKFLYAAQVAYGAIKRQTAAPKAAPGLSVP
jgi:hypothetical protein